MSCSLPSPIFQLSVLLSTMLSISRTYLEMPVLVHELVSEPGLVRPISEINERARLFGCAICADRFNPQG